MQKNGFLLTRLSIKVVPLAMMSSILDEQTSLYSWSSIAYGFIAALKSSKGHNSVLQPLTFFACENKNRPRHGKTGLQGIGPDLKFWI